MKGKNLSYLSYLTIWNRRQRGGRGVRKRKGGKIWNIKRKKTVLGIF